MEKFKPYVKSYVNGKAACIFVSCLYWKPKSSIMYLLLCLKYLGHRSWEEVETLAWCDVHAAHLCGLKAFKIALNCPWTLIFLSSFFRSGSQQRSKRDGKLPRDEIFRSNQLCHTCIFSCIQKCDGNVVLRLSHLLNIFWLIWFTGCFLSLFDLHAKRHSFECFILKPLNERSHNQCMMISICKFTFPHASYYATPNPCLFTSSSSSSLPPPQTNIWASLFSPPPTILHLTVFCPLFPPPPLRLDVHNAILPQHFAFFPSSMHVCIACTPLLLH